MNRFFLEAAAANQSGAMEAETIRKNGRSLKRYNMRILAILLVFGLIVAGCKDDKEDEKEINWNGHRYMRINKGLTWTDAKSYCESLGGYLVTITSAAEQAAVYNLIADGNKNAYWIGGYLTGDGWEWVTGEKWEYTNWAPGEPNDQYGVEDCVHMYRKNDGHGINRAGKWNDIGRAGDDGFPTLKDIGFICECE